jgi:hypothetical protein
MLCRQKYAIIYSCHVNVEGLKNLHFPELASPTITSDSVKQFSHYTCTCKSTVVVIHALSSSNTSVVWLLTLTIHEPAVVYVHLPSPLTVIPDTGVAVFLLHTHKIISRVVNAYDW